MSLFPGTVALLEVDYEISTPALKDDATLDVAATAGLIGGPARIFVVLLRELLEDFRLGGADAEFCERGVSMFW